MKDYLILYLKYIYIFEFKYFFKYSDSKLFVRNKTQIITKKIINNNPLIKNL